MSANEIARLIASYKRAASETGPENDAASSNKAVDHVQAAFRALRETEDGRAAILALVTDPNPNVRLCAAAHSLLWAPDTASPVLRAIAASGGLLGLNATMTLREFEAGRLSFDW